MQRLTVALLLLQLACAVPSARPDSRALTSAQAERSADLPVTPEAEPWPSASARFHDNGAWLGADSAYSIELDDTHVLWLFADTFLDPTADGTRENGPNFFIRNSVGIQSGADRARAHDLSQSQMRFYWGPVQNDVPTSFFHDVDGSERWAWPLHGARLPGGELLLLRMLVVKEAGGLGFRVQISGEHLYAYGVENQGQGHAIYLARWPLAKLTQLAQGALDDPEWWVDQGFVAQSALPPGAMPSPLFQDGQVELSVHYEPERQRFVELQMQGLFVSDARTQLGMRTAPRPEGPWSALQPFYRPDESGAPNAADLAAYAGKAHPEQRGADLVLTYVVNDLKRFPPSDAVYYPQVLRLGYRAARGAHVGLDAGSE